jgi:hypothetical protein
MLLKPLLHLQPIAIIAATWCLHYFPKDVLFTQLQRLRILRQLNLMILMVVDSI